jgi:hypothetical protein
MAEEAMMDEAGDEPQVEVKMNEILAPWALANLPMKMKLAHTTALGIVTAVVEVDAVP